MRKVYVHGYNAITSLGLTTEENTIAMENGISGIRLYENDPVSSVPFYASRINNWEKIGNYDGFTRFERLIVASVQSAIQNSSIDEKSQKTIFIYSTTKGNIENLPEGKRLKLSESADFISKYFKNNNKPVVVSNACISGSVAILIGKRLIESGQYDHAVISGADVVSEFVVSGFQSFKALGTGPCKPFDEKRDGLSLGEGAGAIILSSDKSGSGVVVAGGAISNDANHISGPSRTGDGLFLSIDNAIKEAGVYFDKKEIGYISGHGTATPYNDEMESKALALADLMGVPVNSLKGYFGHTLGAAGIIESIIGIHSIMNGILYSSAGFSNIGVSKEINVIRKTEKKELKAFLKSASGFGGCNAALVFAR